MNAVLCYDRDSCGHRPSGRVACASCQLGQGSSRKKSKAMSNLSASLAVLFLAAIVALAFVYARYRLDLRASTKRLHGTSRMARTSCGPMEYADAGTGAPLLILHGAGGGFDQGMEFGGASLALRGFYVVATSRFGYLRTPLPSDASPTAQ